MINFANAFHILSKEAYGFGPVAIEPGYKVGINDGNFSFTAILTTSKTKSTLGARVRSLPVTCIFGDDVRPQIDMEY